MNNVVIYLRVSTNQQTEESQLKACRNLCNERGYEVVGVFSDHARSAYKSVLRTEYKKVLNLVKNRRIHHIVVWSLDRWCRRGARELKKTIDFLSLYEVQLHSVQEQWLETINIPGGIGDVVKDFLIGIVGWIAHQESQLKSERIKGSIRFQKALRKGKVGRPLIPDEVKKQIIYYLKQGKSYRWIHEEVKYKRKFGKIKHISIATVSKIANK